MPDIFTETTLQKIYNEQRIQNGLVKILASGWNIDSWQSVRELVRSGAGRRYFPIGTQLNVQTKSYGTLIFDVVAHDHHKNADDPTAHTMTLLMHDVIYGRMFDNSELLWANTTGAELAAGTYNFIAYKSDYNQDTKEDGQYQLTTTKAVPAGGGIKHSNMGAWRSSYAQSEVLKGTWATYDASGNTIESGLACTVGSSGTNLGTVSVAKANMTEVIGKLNSTHRNGYGSNNYAESNIRQWLNGKNGNWYKAATMFDLAPSYKSSEGFLTDVDSEFAAVLCNVENITARNTVFEYDGVTSGSYTTTDKMFLASMQELNYGNNNDVAEGDVLEFYEGAGNTDRIKYDYNSTTTARYWWVRSPCPWDAGLARLVSTTGALDGSLAYDGYGAVAACVVG